MSAPRPQQPGGMRTPNGGPSFASGETVSKEKRKPIIIRLGKYLMRHKWGFAAALLLTIVCRIFYIAANSRDLLGELLCTGVGAMFMFHIIENIGMCIGLTPVTGIPLPFFSYGGSNMITSMLGIAIVMLVNSSRNRRL